MVTGLFRVVSFSRRHVWIRGADQIKSAETGLQPLTGMSTVPQIRYPNCLPSKMQTAQGEALACQDAGGIGPGLNFLVLFVSRQKGQLERKE